MPRLWIPVAAAGCALCATLWIPLATTVGAAAPAFVDVTGKAGIAGFRNVQGGDANNKPHIIEVMGGGAAFLDYNNDGNLDILLVRGSSIDKFRKSGGDPVCALYRGDGKGHFEDVTQASGLAASHGWGMGVAIADYDNDGWQDIYVTGYGGNFLFHNRQDGTFEEVARKAGIHGGQWSMGAAFADLDRDGQLDLYVANYLEFPLDHLPVHDSSCNYRGFSVFCGPRGIAGARDAVYFNDGKGHFRNATEALDVDPNKMYGLGVVATDYDNDGWPDLFVANDLTGNLLYHNLGKGKFEETSVIAGAALSEDGVEQGSMGVDFGDFDNDGWPDLYYTNSSFQSNTLLLNSHNGTFNNITNMAGHGSSTYLFVGWGMSFADLNNDGWEDLFVVNGHLYPEADKFDMGLEYKQRALVFMNQRDKTFREAGAEFGLSQRWKSRGMAAGDYDNDGRLDILINNLDDAPVLLHNEMPRTGHWLLVRCVGTRSNRSAVGARLTLRAGDLREMREIKAGTSYLSSNDLRVHFGLGAHEKADSMEIKWPSGLVETVKNIRADQVLTVEEGKSN